MRLTSMVKICIPFIPLFLWDSLALKAFDPGAHGGLGGRLLSPEQRGRGWNGLSGLTFP